jgi:hypothetical protein
MSISIHQASVPVFIQGLKGLKGVLTKAAALAETKKWDPDALLKARLYPDMFPLIRQVQIATDFAKGGAARLAAVEVPAWDDVETSFEDLKGQAMPNFFFHITTAYAILRHNGVEVGKRDFLGTA